MPLRLCTILSLAVLALAPGGATAVAQGNEASPSTPGADRAAAADPPWQRREARRQAERRRSAADQSKLYAPFPEPAVRSRARRFLSLLDVSGISARELRDGVFLPADDPPSLDLGSRAEPSERAGVGGAGGRLWPAVAGLAALAGAGAWRRSGGGRAAD
jgi:hypothetical protein